MLPTARSPARCPPLRRRSTVPLGLGRQGSAVALVLGTVTPEPPASRGPGLSFLLFASLVLSAVSYTCPTGSDGAGELLDFSQREFIDILLGITLAGSFPLQPFGMQLNLSLHHTTTGGASARPVVVTADDETIEPLYLLNRPDAFVGSVANVPGSEVWLSVIQPGSVYGSIELPATSGDPAIVIEIEAGSVIGAGVRARCRNAGELDEFEEEERLDHAADPQSRRMRAREDWRRGRREVARPSTEHAGCSVFVDVDQAFFNHWGEAAGGRGDVASQMEFVSGLVMSIVNDVDSLYSAETDLRLFVGGIRLHISNNNIGADGASSGADFLYGYESWLAPGSTRGAAGSSRPRGPNTATASDSCMNLLLTHRSLGGTIGTANMASASSNVVGGACETYLWRDSSTQAYHALNSMFASSHGRNRVLSVREVVSTVAHEIGEPTRPRSMRWLYFSCAAPASPACASRILIHAPHRPNTPPRPLCPIVQATALVPSTTVHQKSATPAAGTLTNATPPPTRAAAFLCTRRSRTRRRQTPRSSRHAPRPSSARSCRPRAGVWSGWGLRSTPVRSAPVRLRLKWTSSGATSRACRSTA